MNDNYKELFGLIAHGTANLAEEVGSETSFKMRDDFLDLKDKISDDKEITLADVSKLYIATSLAITNLENQIKKIEKVKKLYQTQLLDDLKSCLHGEKKFEEIFNSNN